MKYTKLFIIILLFLTSCVNRHTSYRVLNKNGKVVYFERKKPLYNSSIENNEKEMANIQNINKTVKNIKAQQVNPNVNMGKEGKTIEENLVLESDAYTLRSVIDKVVKDTDIKPLAQMVQKNQKPKTIEDFNIPESYFDSNEKKKAELRKQQLIELNNKKALEEQQKQQKKGFFAKLFNKNKNSTQNTNNKNNISDTNTNVASANNVSKKAIFNENQKFGKSAGGTKISNYNNQLQIIGSTTITTKTNTTAASGSALIKGKYYIQLGSFVDKNKATVLSNKFKNVGEGSSVVPVSTKNGLMYRVVIGVFDTKSMAEKEMEKVLDKGHFDCYVFKK